MPEYCRPHDRRKRHLSRHRSWRTSRTHSVLRNCDVQHGIHRKRWSYANYCHVCAHHAAFCTKWTAGEKKKKKDRIPQYLESYSQQASAINQELGAATEKLDQVTFRFGCTAGWANPIVSWADQPQNIFNEGHIYHDAWSNCPKAYKASSNMLKEIVKLTEVKRNISNM